MWPDKETNIDYLNFGYLVDLIVEIAMNRELTPSTIGLYGDSRSFWREKLYETLIARGKNE